MDLTNLLVWRSVSEWWAQRFTECSSEHGLFGCFSGDAGLFGIAIGLVNSLLIVWILRIEGRRFEIERRDSIYGDLDDIYQGILSQRLERPWLDDFALFRETPAMDVAQARAARRIHAYIVWTFLESICDKLSTRDARDVQRVWQPVFRAEAERYLPELLEFWQQDGSFQTKFVDFVRGGGFCGIFRDPAEEARTHRFARRAREVLGPAVR